MSVWYDSLQFLVWFVCGTLCSPLVSAHGVESPSENLSYCGFLNNQSIPYLPEEWNLRWDNNIFFVSTIFKKFERSENRSISQNPLISISLQFQNPVAQNPFGLKIPQLNIPWIQKLPKWFTNYDFGRLNQIRSISSLQMKATIFYRDF